MAAVLETRLRQAQAEPLSPIDLMSCLVADELARRSERLLERHVTAGERPAENRQSHWSRFTVGAFDCLICF